VVSAVALCLALAPSLSYASGGGDGPVLSIGEQAPGFFLKPINAEAAGEPRVVLKKVFDDPQTKAVILSFFATWCAPCKKELPILQGFFEAHQKDGLRIVVISIDKEEEALKQLPAFISERGLTFPVVSDRYNLLARRYLGTTTALPSLFITDGDGVIRQIHQSYGEDAPKQIEREFLALLGLPVPAPSEAEATPAPAAEASDDSTQVIKKAGLKAKKKKRPAPKARPGTKKKAANK